MFLGFAALSWGISVVGVFMAWSTAMDALQGLRAQPIAYDRMLDYWLRMASGAFALVGCWYLVPMIWPRKFAQAIPWFGALMLAANCAKSFVTREGVEKAVKAYVAPEVGLPWPEWIKT
jgi:hypothetical protein